MNRLKELRQEKNAKQEDLAEVTGVSAMTISRWEKGESNIKPEKAQQLADYFGVSVGYLLGYSNYKNKDRYLDENSLDLVIESDMFNAIETIGEKNLPLVYKFLREEFEEEYSDVFLNDEEHDFTEDDVDDAVSTAMGNIGDGFWNLPDSLVRLIFFWSTLKSNEREQLLALIRTLSLNNLKEQSPTNSASKKST